MKEILEFIDANEILAFDTETTGLNTRKDRVIGFGISNEHTGYYVDILYYNTDNHSLVPGGFSKEQVGQILLQLQKKKLITWNASFDMRMTKNNLGVDLLPSLYADVLLMKHTCDEEFPFGLKEVGTKIFGSSVTKEKEEMQASIKSRGGKAKEYFKAETPLLAKYCIQDCLLTYRLFLHYSDTLSDQGLSKFYYSSEVLPLYKEVTIPMESAGVAVALPLLQQTLEEITLDIARTEIQIQQAIAPHLGLFMNWFLKKDYPLKTFKGNLTALGKAMQRSGFTDEFRMQAGAWQKDNPTGYMFNLHSKHHLKKLFFDTLKEEPLSRTPTGQPQVDEEFMASIAHKYEFVNQLIQYNKLTKIKGTYIERFLEEQENGTFYPSYQQHRTVSGRYGSDLQQLPRPAFGDSIVAKQTNKIRKFIKARDCHKLISADYAQLEPRCFAHTSGDKALQDIFSTGTDFYSTIAQRTEGLEEVSKEQRQKAKAYALGIAYGMTGYKLKFEIGCDQETADKLVSDYLAAFPDLAAWMEESKKTAYQEGFVTSQGGRMRRLGRAKALYSRYGLCILDDLALWKRYNSNPALYEQAKADRREFKNLCNNAINFQVQSLAASIVNKAAIMIARRFKAEGMRSQIIMQVHDELVVEAPDREVPVACIIMKTCMENVTKLSVPLIAEPKIGSNFSECK